MKKVLVGGPARNAKRIVLAGGCFDLIHFGHVSFLTRAKALGDYLVVALESDENVKKYKGPTRPIHTQAQRKQMLEALRVVDQVILLPIMNSDDDYANMVMDIKPTIIAVTDGDPILEKKKKHAEMVGATVVAIPKIQTPSTTSVAKLLELE